MELVVVVVIEAPATDWNGLIIRVGSKVRSSQCEPSRRGRKRDTGREMSAGIILCFPLLPLARSHTKNTKLFLTRSVVVSVCRRRLYVDPWLIL
jgi:hypothetical protein